MRPPTSTARVRARAATVRAIAVAATLATSAAGCALWPSFPDSLLREAGAADAAGLDARSDAVETPGDAPDVDTGAHDAAGLDGDAAVPGDDAPPVDAAADDAPPDDAARADAARDATARDATADAPPCGALSEPCCAGASCGATTLVCRATDSRCVTCAPLATPCSATLPCCAGLRCIFVLSRLLCER